MRLDTAPARFQRGLQMSPQMSLVFACGLLLFSFLSFCRADSPPAASPAPSISESLVRPTSEEPVSNDTDHPAPTVEEQARQLQEQVVNLLLVRLDTAATFMGRGQTKDAIAQYQYALQMEPFVSSLKAQKSELSSRADALQDQIFEAQKQILNESLVENLASQKIAVEGQLRAVQHLLDLVPSLAEAHANLAHLLVQTGAASEGITQYQQAITLKPALAPMLRPAIIHAHLTAADQLARLGRPEALAEYRAAIKLDPGNSSARVGLATALMGQGKATEAVPELVEAARLNPKDGEAGLTLGLALYQSGRREEARQQWRGLTASGDPQTAAEAHGMLARYLLDPVPSAVVPKTPIEAEVQKCREQVRNYPNEAFSHSNLALALHNARQFDEALQEVQIALKLDPESVEAHTNLGLILSDSAHDDEAEKQYRQALKLDSDNGAVHNDFGVVFFNRQQWKQAEYEFHKALEVDHSDPYAHHNLADTLLQEGQLAQSIRECGKTLQYDALFGPAYATRGLVEDRMGNTALGLADLKQAIQLSPDPDQEVLNLAEPLHQFAGKAAAVRQFGEIMRLYPETAEGHESLGHLLLAAGQDQNAVTEFQAAIRLKPDQTSSHLQLARTFLRLDDLEEAAAEARAVLLLEPKSAAAHNTLGLALYQQGQKPDARQQWQAALTLDDKDAARDAAGFLSEFP